MADLTIRDATDQDLPFIADAWARTAIDRLDMPRGWTPHVYRTVIRRGIWGVLNDAETHALVLELVPGHTTAVIVWQAGHGGRTLVHFAYTRRGGEARYRRHGLASQLLDAVLERSPGELFATFTTPDGLKFLTAYRERNART